MDQINSNPHFDPARLYQSQAAPQKTGARPANASPAEPINTPPAAAEPADFSKMFDDDALLKLQGNLEAIAQMAEKSLKQIDDQ